jgi:hypothetical protein
VPLQHDQDAQAPEPVQREHPVRAIHPTAMVALRGSTFQCGGRPVVCAGPLHPLYLIVQMIEQVTVLQSLNCTDGPQPGPHSLADKQVGRRSWPMPSSDRTGSHVSSFFSAGYL